jgi:hypothetical protein
MSLIDTDVLLDTEAESLNVEVPREIYVGNGQGHHFEAKVHGFRIVAAGAGSAAPTGTPKS